MKNKRPARSGAGNASQMGNLHKHSTAPAATNTARPAIGTLPIGTMFLLIGDVEPLVIKGRRSKGVEIATPNARVAHMTLRPDQVVQIVAVPSGYKRRATT